jgi:hypothetical protein
MSAGLAEAVGDADGAADGDGRGEPVGGTEVVGVRRGDGVPWFEDGMQAARRAAPAAMAAPRNRRRLSSGFGVTPG